jgi:hypothetical protein
LALGLVALASIVYLVVVLMYARMRPIAKDEGFYTSAARLVWEGKTANRDFAYHQGPALPYIYSLVWGLGGHSLIVLRSLSAILGTIAVALWGIWLIRINRFSIAIALGAFLVILANPQWIIWNVVVKTFAVANLREEIVGAVSAGAADLLIFDSGVKEAFHIQTAAELQKLRAAVEQNYRPVGRVDFPAPWTSDSIEIYRLRDRSGSE